MTLIVLVVLAILAIVTVPFIFAAIIGSDLAGANANLSVVGEDELLMPSHDLKQYAMIQGKKQKIDELVSLANASYKNQTDLEAASQALEQAVRHYEAIREQAESAVVELNLAFLAKDRFKIERKREASQQFMDELEVSFKCARQRAGFLLEEEKERILKKEDKRYDKAVQERYEKLTTLQDVNE